MPRVEGGRRGGARDPVRARCDAGNPLNPTFSFLHDVASLHSRLQHEHTMGKLQLLSIPPVTQRPESLLSATGLHAVQSLPLGIIFSIMVLFFSFPAPVDSFPAPHTSLTCLIVILFQFFFPVLSCSGPVLEIKLSPCDANQIRETK